MAWGMYPGLPTYGRQNGEVVVELNARSSPPPPPYELIGFLPEGVYQRRMSELFALLRRYVWPTWLKVYCFFATALTFISPWPIMFGIESALTSKIDLSQDPVDARGNTILTDDQIHKFQLARLASYGAIVGTLFVIWGPYLIFSILGSRKINKLVDSFTTQDSNPSRPAHQHLRWTVRNRSTFSGRANLAIKMQVETMKGISNFHPQAYLPTYIAGAPQGIWDPTANGGKGDYVQQKNNGGFRPPSGPPPMTEVPLNGDPEKMV